MQGNRNWVRSRGDLVHSQLKLTEAFMALRQGGDRLGERTRQRFCSSQLREDSLAVPRGDAKECDVAP